MKMETVYSWYTYIDVGKHVLLKSEILQIEADDSLLCLILHIIREPNQ